MSSFAIPKISSIDINTLQKVLSSREISEAQKTQFIQKNKTEIAYLMSTAISAKEFKYIMKNRPLQKFRPLKNSFTKLGDKKLLAEMLGIPDYEVTEYISEVSENIKKTNELDFWPKNELESIRTYVYRHGSKDQLLSFLDSELKNAKDVISVIYRTLEYNAGGIADYFIRPIHKMDNKTLVKLYHIIDKNLETAEQNGSVSMVDRARISKWALIKIYSIQNNNKLINAIKTYKVLSK